jgi:hypothetical protein
MLVSNECRNVLSARNNPDIVTRLLQEEIDKGFIRGPFSKSTFKQQNWSQEQLPPISEYLLMRFIAFCETQKHLRYSTIKSYLCSICFFYLQKGGFITLEHFW